MNAVKFKLFRHILNDGKVAVVITNDVSEDTVDDNWNALKPDTLMGSA